MEKTKSTFEDLEIWQLARDFRKKISGLIKKFPSIEKFRLADQMARASRSVTANIAEGYGRYHYQENIQFCRQARGSLYEMIDHLTVALDEKHISDELFEELKGEAFIIVKRLNGYIQYLNKKKSSP